MISQLNITKGMELKYTGFLRNMIAEQEKQLRETNELLEKKVTERTNELDEKNEQLRSLAAGLKGLLVAMFLFFLTGLGLIIAARMI